MARHSGIEDGPEFGEVCARLREVNGPALAYGQTPCCYALSKDHGLIHILGMSLELVGPRPTQQSKSKEITS
jgi:hypothetical protein